MNRKALCVYQFVTCPIFLGNGQLLLTAIAETLPLVLVGQGSASGYVMLRYVLGNQIPFGLH